MRASDFDPWLESAVAEVLEAMCFLSTDGEAAAPESLAWESDSITGRLDFAGAPSGSFGVRTPRRTARLIAANFLGEDEDALSDAQAAEVIGELANMTCGSLLSRVESKRVFELSVPGSEPRGSDGKPGVDRIGRIFVLDEGVLQAWLEIRP